MRDGTKRAWVVIGVVSLLLLPAVVSAQDLSLGAPRLGGARWGLGVPPLSPGVFGGRVAVLAQDGDAEGPEIELPPELEGAGALGGATSGQEPEGGDGDEVDRFSGRTDPTSTLTERVAAIVQRTVLGGYGEYEYHGATDQEDSYFLHHRYVLFVYSQIHPRISAATEVEWEFGGTPRKADGEQGVGEVLLEFSVLDFKVVDALVLRGGIVLVPVGAFNVRHDSPTRDLTERPLVDLTVIPTTWFEAGAGGYGTVDTGGGTELTWELYVINGLDARIDSELGLKPAIGSKGEDNNNDKAVVGRVAFSPTLGTEVGVSGYTGEYNKRDGRVNLLAVDTTLRFGALELLFEGVQAWIDPGFVEGFSAGSAANTRKSVPEGMAGFYAQANVHFRIPGLWDLLPDDLSAMILTGVVRYGEVDTDLDAAEAGGRQRLTFGLNVRPIEAVVLKTDYQLDWSGPRGLLPALGWSEQGEGVERHGPEFKFVASAAMLF